MLGVKIKRFTDGRHEIVHPIPTYATYGSAAVDFYAHISRSLANTVTMAVSRDDKEPVAVTKAFIKPGERMLIPLGVAMSIPKGYELRLSPRSGLALKKGITLTNSPGLIDSDYRGEIGAIVHNLGDETFVINDGDKICQGGFYEYKRAEFEEVAELDSTERGEGGFGSTGTK